VKRQEIGDEEDLVLQPLDFWKKKIGKPLVE